MKRMIRTSDPLLERTALPVYLKPLFILFLLLRFYAGSAQVVLYVDDVNGNDANGGTSWASAYKTVSLALQTARANTNVDSILVAKGTYYPTGVQNATNRDSSFVILRGKLKLYGGYPNGGGTRDMAANPTILSGDIGNVNDTIDNSYHVMVIAGNIPSTADSIVVDGFTITKGNATGTTTFNYGSSPVYQGHGGGIYVKDNATAQKTALRNCIISSNTAQLLGGGVEIDIASPYIQNCLFTNNHTINNGGALANDNYAGPYVAGCSFSGNTANSTGGAVYSQNNTSSPSFINCNFTGNKAMPLAPATYDTFGGAMFNNTGAIVTIATCIFTANSSTGGGGAVCSNSNAVTNITFSVFERNICVNAAGNIGSGGALQTNVGGGTYNVSNCVLVNNIAGGTADDGGGGIMAYKGTFNCFNLSLYGNTTQSTSKPNGNGISVMSGATVNFSNSIAWSNPAQQLHNAGTLNYNYSLIKGITATLPNLNIDPQFANTGNPIGADGIWGTADDGLQLTNCSPVVNMGSNALVPGSITTDETGNARIFGTAVDMGAYEFQSAPVTINFSNIAKTYGDGDAAVPNVTNCSGLPMTFTIADNSIATILSSNLHVIKAGTTTITAHTLNGAADVTVNLTVDPKPVTITADALSKAYGNADPVFTYTYTPALVAGDAFAGSLERVAGEGPGSYAINQGTLALSSNYAITYNASNLTIMAVLPVEMVSFKTEWFEQGKTAEVKFVMLDESAICCYEIERSGDGITFTKIGKVEARNGGGQHYYNFVDHKATGKKLYYRLKTIFNNGVTAYSNIQLLQSNIFTQTTVFPNPATDVLQLLLNNDHETIDVQIINSAGQTIKKISNISTAGQLLSIPVSYLNAGIYLLYLQSGTEKLVLQFVKK